VAQPIEKEGIGALDPTLIPLRSIWFLLRAALVSLRSAWALLRPTWIFGGSPGSDRLSQRHEPRDIDFLGPHRWLDPGGGEERGKVESTGGGEGFQRLAQHLAPLAERGLGQRREGRRVA
jgi:hypothetical protein